LETSYPLRFKAAVLERLDAPLAIDEVVFEGPLQTGQVLVKVQYSGICGKQLEEIAGTRGPDPYLPHMLGHEGGGVVIDVGPGVNKVGAGDHVVLHWLKGSGMESATPVYKRAGKRVNAGRVTTFNEYGVLSENRMTRVPADTDLKVACLLGCAVTTGVGAILNDANVRPGESVAVFGCGGVGLSIVQGAALVNAYPIIAVDQNPDSLRLALDLGATHVIDTKSADAVAEIRQATDGEGANYVMVAVGNTEVIELANRAGSVPGSVFLVGGPPAGSKITVDALDIHFRRALLGSHGGDSVPDRDIPRYLGLYMRGRLKLEEMVERVFPLHRINNGIETLREGTTGRCLVRMVDDGD